MTKGKQVKHRIEKIQKFIFTLRGRRVILDQDLASLYGVPTKAFNQAVKRNRNRFPKDFAFIMTAEERVSMRSQIVTASKRNLRYRPLVFTEYGAVMAANILNSPYAIQRSVFVIRAFISMRNLLAAQLPLAAELKALEEKLTQRLDTHETAIVDVLRRLIKLFEPEPETPLPEKPKIGFHP